MIDIDTSSVIDTIESRYYKDVMNWLKQYPILWRVIDFDEDGDPLLYSERILTLKAFDAGGDYHPDDGSDWNRYTLGSNYWED